MILKALLERIEADTVGLDDEVDDPLCLRLLGIGLLCATEGVVRVRMIF